MKRLLWMFFLAASSVLVLTAVNSQADESATGRPPIGQALVREGDLAVSLAESLKLGATDDEAEAESRLTDVGITPHEGWIADYPATPDVLFELQNAVGAAADANKIAMGRDEALLAFQNLLTELGLPLRADQDQFAENQAPVGESAYSPEALDDYYSTEGPPVVTYYAPPMDYYSMYNWVPYPFWFGGFSFAGFFVLNDFHRVHRVVVIDRHGFRHRVNRMVSNHLYNRDLGRVVKVDPIARMRGERVGTVAVAPPSGGLNHTEAQRGAVVRSGTRRGGENASGSGDRGRIEFSGRPEGSGRSLDAPSVTRQGPVGVSRGDDSSHRSFSGGPHFENHGSFGGGRPPGGHGFSTGRSFGQGGFSGEGRSGRGSGGHGGGCSRHC